MPLIMLRFVVGTCAFCACLAGCAGRSRTAATTPAALPGPSTMEVSGAVTAAQFDVAGRLSARVRSEAIAAKPLRSRYRGEVMLVLKQGAGTPVDISMVVEGEYDGSPTGGISQAINRLIDAVAAAESFERWKPATQPAVESGED